MSQIAQQNIHSVETVSVEFIHYGFEKATRDFSMSSLPAFVLKYKWAWDTNGINLLSLTVIASLQSATLIAKL